MGDSLEDAWVRDFLDFDLPPSGGMAAPVVDEAHKRREAAFDEAMRVAQADLAELDTPEQKEERDKIDLELIRGAGNAWREGEFDTAEALISQVGPRVAAEKQRPPAFKLVMPTPEETYNKTKDGFEALLVSAERSGVAELGKAAVPARKVFDAVKKEADAGAWDKVDPQLFDFGLQEELLQDAVKDAVLAAVKDCNAWIMQNGRKSTKANAAGKKLTTAMEVLPKALMAGDYATAIQAMIDLGPALAEAKKSLAGHAEDKKKADSLAKKINDPDIIDNALSGALSFFNKGPTAADVVKDVTTLIAGGVEPGTPIRKATHALLDKLTEDYLYADEFPTQELEKIERLTSTLAADPEVSGPAGKWGAADADEKLAALRKIVQTQAAQLKLNPAPVVSMMPANKRKPNLAGFLDPEDGNIYIDFEGANAKTSFMVMSDTAMHETAHAWQRQIAQQYASGKMKPSDPNYTAAMIFAVNLMPGVYVDGGVSGEDDKVYRKQPLEDHAFKFGTSSAKSLGEKLAKGNG